METDIVRTLELSHEQGAELSWLYRNGSVLNRSDHDSGVRLTVSAAQRIFARFDSQFGVDMAAE